MTLEEAISLVSYKLALKNGEQALTDSFLDKTTIQKALDDKENNCEQKVDLKLYMQATKMLKQHKIECFKSENETFLQENSHRPEIHLTDSGLQYEVLKNGDGKTPSIEDQVTVHYRGSLINNDEFDSSYTRNSPSTFHVKKVIKGWQEGLQLMREGSHYKFFIPQELGYGERGNDSKVPAYATLFFEVQLISVD